jgi:hypothetical protein
LTDADTQKSYIDITTAGLQLATASLFLQTKVFADQVDLDGFTTVTC